jgi:hypothetical protein
MVQQVHRASFDGKKTANVAATKKNIRLLKQTRTANEETLYITFVLQ